MADLSVQKPKDFEPSAVKLLQKTADLMHRVSGHALTVNVNPKRNYIYYASKELEALATDAGASAFFCQQLVHNFSPNQALISRFIPATLKEQTVMYEADKRARHRSWGDRSSTLQALAQQIVADHPDNTILLFIEGGKDVATLQEASACVRGIFQQPGWAQHIMQRIRTALVSVANSTGAAVQAPRVRPERRNKRAALTLDPDSEATASQPAPARQRRKLVPTFVMPLGSVEWYHRKLLTDPATYCAAQSLCKSQARLMHPASKSLMVAQSCTADWL